MSVVRFRELLEGRTGRESVKQDGTVVREYTRVWQVIVDSMADGPLQVKAAVPVFKNDPYITDTESDLQALCTDKTASVEESPWVWSVQTDYSTETSDPEQQQQDEQDPTDSPPQYSWGYRTEKVIVERDNAGQPILNSAGDPFETPVEKNLAVLTLKISRNETPAQWNPITAYGYIDSVNSVSWYNFPAGTVHLLGPTANSEYERGESYWKVDYQFEMRPVVGTGSAFMPGILDQGYNESIGGVSIPILDSTTGHPPQRPKLLDGNGLIATGPTYLQFDIYNEQDFNALGLV